MSETMGKDVFCLSLRSDSQMDHDITPPKQTLYENKNLIQVRHEKQHLSRSIGK